MVNEGLTKEEFVKSFATILDFVKKSSEKNDKDFEKLKSEITVVFGRMKSNIESELSSLTEESKSSILKEIERCEAMMSEHYSTMDSFEEKMLVFEKRIKSIKDGQDADEGKIIKQVSESLVSKIPSIDEIEKDLPRLGEAIRDGLELLKGDERLDKSAVKGIEEIEKAIEELKRRKTTIIGGGGGSQGGGRIVKAYDLSPYLNGSTKTFNLPSMWRVISVHSSSFPMAFRENVDFTWTPTSITFTSEVSESSTLASGQTVTITYSE